LWRESTDDRDYDPCEYDYKAIAVWPVFIADHYAEMLTPNQIEKLYEAHNALHQAADRIAELERTIGLLNINRKTEYDRD
jgi:hypothetical protein